MYGIGLRAKKVETYIIQGPFGPEQVYRAIGRRVWVRFTPNPGFLLWRWHWCKARGWHDVEEG